MLTSLVVVVVSNNSHFSRRGSFGSVTQMSRQYLNAARALEAVERGQSFKAYCAKQSKFGKTEFALASEALKFNQILNQILSATQLTGKSLDVSEPLLKVMVFDLLFGKKGKIDSGGVVKRKVMDNKEALVAALNDLMKKNGATEPRELLPSYAMELPKYVRINSLKIDNDDVGLKEIQRTCSEAKFDSVIPSLVALPAGARSFGEHPWVKDGRLIIQDKASCFSSQCCVELWRGGDIIDACAAPGNKTTHMAALVHRNKTVKRKAKIFAFDKSPVRCDLLQRRVVNAGADHIIEVSNTDFLSVDVSSEKYKSVTCALVDPSCSGSGIRAVDRVAEAHEEDGSVEDRLQKLRTFQISAVRKAMSFPKVEVVVYSTCSIHIEENESVVAEILSALRQEGQQHWKVVEPRCLSAWKRRGVPCEGLSAEEQRNVIRCDPTDGLNGFFVAVFVKDTAASDITSGKSKDAEPCYSGHGTSDSSVKEGKALPMLSTKESHTSSKPTKSNSTELAGTSKHSSSSEGNSQVSMRPVRNNSDTQDTESASEDGAVTTTTSITAGRKRARGTTAEYNCNREADEEILKRYYYPFREESAPKRVLMWKPLSSNKLWF